MADAGVLLGNRPVLIEEHGRPRLYVFTDVDGGQCTGRTKQRKRCRNPVWDQGQMAPCDAISVGPYTVHYYGPLPDHVAHKYLDQRCRVHDTPDAVAYCDPEWERFDSKRHARFLHEPMLSEFAECLGYSQTPAVEGFGRALRREYDVTDRQRLAEILLGE